MACGPRIRRPLRRCVVCTFPRRMASIKLCDAPVGAGTCDAVVCVEHATPVSRTRITVHVTPRRQHREHPQTVSQVP